MGVICSIVIVGVKIRSSAIVRGGGISGVKLPIIIVGVKIGSSAIVHPFPKCTCSQEGNAQG